MRHYYNFGGGLAFYSMRNTSDTVLLIHSNTTDGSTTFTDSSTNGHSVTASGDAQHSTGAKFFGTTSMKFDGGGDYLTVTDHADFDITSNDFSCDFWLLLGALPASGTRMVIFSKGDDCYFQLDLLLPGIGYKFEYKSEDGATLGQWYWANAEIGKWVHVALLSAWGGTSGNGMVTINGSPIDGFDTFGDFTTDTDDLLIGQHQTTSYLNGYIDEFRLVNGTCMWTSPFITPFAQYS